ncbi:hypothetical protein LTR86_008114 [Recurvomyces mirabilis]|nr:hypothetical protein LTR86_008114 [Recurvomyces mirabilis]
MPYGRGGAGNIYAVGQEVARTKADVEANRSTAASSGVDDEQPTDQMREGEQQYAHTGRGGAGNYYSPQQLTETGSFSNAARSHIIGDGTQAPSPQASNKMASSATTSEKSSSGLSRKVGRGGAGNYAFGVGESEENAARKRIDEEQRRQQVQADVEKGVEAMLAPPPKARVTGAEF